MVKICSICDKEFIANQKTEKYCTTKCAYKAMDIKRKNKCCNCNGRIYWISSMTMWGFLLGLIAGIIISL